MRRCADRVFEVLPFALVPAFKQINSMDTFGRVAKIFVDPADGVQRAYLRQRMFIRCSKPLKVFPAVGQPNGGRSIPADRISVLVYGRPRFWRCCRFTCFIQPKPVPISKKPGLVKTNLTPIRDSRFRTN